MMREKITNFGPTACHSKKKKQQQHQKNKQKLSRTVNHKNPVKYHLCDLNTCHEYYSNA